MRKRYRELVAKLDHAVLFFDNVRRNPHAENSCVVLRDSEDC